MTKGMHWVVVAGEQVGPVNKGAHLADLVTLFNVQPQAFVRTSESGTVEYAFDEAAVHASVDAEGLVRRLVFFPPNEVFLRGVQLLGRPLRDVLDDLKKCTQGFVLVDAGAWCSSEGVLLIQVDGIVDGVEVALGE